MSLESAKAFMDRIKNDEDFQRKVTECNDSESRKAFVLKEGFDFTVQEIKACVAELSDEELKMVGGGDSDIVPRHECRECGFCLLWCM